MEGDYASYHKQKEYEQNGDKCESEDTLGKEEDGSQWFELEGEKSRDGRTGNSKREKRL